MVLQSRVTLIDDLQLLAAFRVDTVIKNLKGVVNRMFNLKRYSFRVQYFTNVSRKVHATIIVSLPNVYP